MQFPSNLWQRTPPAIFPPVLGLFGLGLAWRRASEVFAVPSAVGEAILGAVSLLYLFCLLAYWAKIFRRPSALFDEMQILPGRAGMSTSTMSLMLFAATLVPYAPSLAKTILVIGLIGHLAVIAMVALVLSRSPDVKRRMSPVWHLSFVGAIVAPMAAVPLGWSGLSLVVLVLTFAAAITIWIGSTIVLRSHAVPPPLRPTLAIHLAPASLLGIAAALLGYNSVATAFGVLSIAIAALLVFRVRYLTVAGFSPFWGTFTFPMSAFAGLMLLLAQIVGEPFRSLAGVALIVATLAIPVIAFRIMKMWASGTLAVKTNASKV